MALRLVPDDREIDASLAAVCGAYCGACPVYRAWAARDMARLEALAAQLGTPVERLMCTGCRTPAAFCLGGDCEIKQCARERGVAFCPDCADYPCDALRQALRSRPYLPALCRDALRLHGSGVTAWLREQDARWRCAECGTPVAAGTGTCAHCGSALALR